MTKQATHNKQIQLAGASALAQKVSIGNSDKQIPFNVEGKYIIIENPYKMVIDQNYTTFSYPKFRI